MTETDSQDRARCTLAYFKATAEVDERGMAVIEDSTDLRQLARDLAVTGIGFIAAVAEDPSEHISRMFMALDIRR